MLQFHLYEMCVYMILWGTAQTATLYNLGTDLLGTWVSLWNFETIRGSLMRPNGPN